jgi:hypothetical protein
MSIISKSFVADNLRFAIGNMGTTLTAVKPTNGETYQANKQGMDAAFDVFENGREITIDTKFYIAKDDYTDLPTKGMILTDGVSNYKVINLSTDAIGATLQLECSSEVQR